MNDKKWYDATVKLQIQKATQWCKTYNIAYNQDIFMQWILFHNQQYLFF